MTDVLEAVDGTEFRSLASADVELRADGDGRTLAGILVPYGMQQRIDRSLVEEFVPGAFADQVRAMTPGRLESGILPLCMNHEPHGGVRIGKIVNLREDAAGLYGEARVSNTTTGNDTLALLNDGILREWSIGFRPIQNRAAGVVTQRIKSHLTELAIVGQGAYGAAASVGAIRAAANCAKCGQFMTPVIEDDSAAEDTVDPAEVVVSNAIQAARLIAQLPMLSLHGPPGAPGAPASFGNAATFAP